MLASTFYLLPFTQVAWASYTPVTIEESDGTPSVKEIATLKVSNGTLTDDGNGVVTLVNTGTSTLQTAYDADVNGSDAILALTANDDSLIFRNPAASGSDSTFLAHFEQLATGAVDNTLITHAGTGYALRVNDDGTTTDSTPFVINAAGNVGIGTTIASRMLHLSSTNPEMVFSETDATADNRIWNIDADNQQFRMGLFADGFASGASWLVVSRSNDETETITFQSGLPNGEIVKVNDLDATGANTSFGGLSLASNPGTNFVIGKKTVNSTPYLQIRTVDDGIERFTMDAAGNVGIGSVTPTAPLNVNGATFTPAAGANASIAGFAGAITEAGSDNHARLSGVEIAPPTITGGAATVTDAASLYVSNAPSATATNGSYAFWVDNGGSRFDGGVGIGTTPPTIGNAVMVNGASTDSFVLDVRTATTDTSANTTGASFFNQTTNSAFDGKVKKGVTIASTGASTGGAGAANVNYGLYVDTVSGSDENYAAYFSTNVGIGSTAPAELLDVAGRVKLAQTTAPGVTTDKLYNVAGALYWNGTNISAAGSPTLDAITAAVGSAVRNHGANAIEWQWNSLAGGSGLKLSSTSTAAASNTQTLLDVVLSGANAGSNQQTYAASFKNSHTGTGSTNIGAYAEGTGGAASNYGFYSNPTVSASADATGFGADMVLGTAGSAAIWGGRGTVYSVTSSGTQTGALYGLQGGVSQNAAGTVNLAYGLSGNVSATDGTIVNAHSLDVSAPTKSGSGNITNAVTGVLTMPTVGTAANVGLAIDTTPGSGNYSFYNGSTVQSYFAGNVGIGTTTIDSRVKIVTGAGETPFKIFANGGEFQIGEYGVTGIRTNAEALNSLTVSSGFDSVKGVVVRGNSGTQSANLQEWQNSALTPLVVVGPAGNVGIGSATPAELLDVAGRVKLVQTTAPGVTTDKLYNVAGALYWNGTNISAAAAPTLQNAYTNDASGAADITLTDAKDIEITLPDTTTDPNFEITTAGAGIFRFNDDGTFTDSTPFIIAADGNVGIGTTGPSNLLHVQGASDPTISAIDSTNSLAVIMSAHDWEAFVGTAGNYPLGLGTNGAGIIWVTELGNVGIGDAGADYLLELHDATATPAFALSDDDVAHGLTTLAQTDVFAHLTSLSTTAGGAQLTAVSDADAQALSVRGVIGATNPTDTIPAIKFVGAKSNGTTGIADLAAAETVFQVANNDDAAALTILGNGNVGIGTATTSGKLHVYDGSAADVAVRVEASTDNVAGLWLRSGVYDSYIYHLNGTLYVDTESVTSALVLLEGGNLGIGSATPAELLDVAGRVKLAQTTAPGVTTDKLYNVAGALYWNGTNISAAAAPTLQNAYTNDASGDADITTTDAKDISITLADTTTDANFEITTIGDGIFRFNDDGTFTDSTPFIIAADGNVGIGTTAPGYPLDVWTYSGDMRVTGTGSQGAGIFLENTNGSTQWWYLSANGTDTTYGPSKGLFINNGFTTRMVIGTDGNVGIGDTSPDYLFELYDATNTPVLALSDDDVAHGLTTLAQTDVFAHLTSLSTTAGGAQLTAVSDADAQALSVRGVIGATNPTDTIPAIKFIGSKSNGTTGIADLAAAETVFQVANNDDAAALTVLGSGNAGIGTTSPGSLLAIYGATPVMDIETSDAAVIAGDDLGTIQFKGLDATLLHNVGAMIRAEAAGAWDGGDVDDAPTALQFFTQSNGTANGMANPRMVIDSTGNVGIGTTAPAELLHLSGGNLAFDPSNGVLFGDNFSAGLVGEGYVGANEVALMTNYLKRLTVIHDGNVGIGSATPAELLDVAGRVKLVQTTAPGVTTDKLYNVAGALYWNGTNISAAASPTLQNAYTNDASGDADITTTDAKDISITLANTTTDANFEITTADTGVFRFNDDGTFTDSTPFVIDGAGNVGIGTATPGVKVQISAGQDDMIRLNNGATTAIALTVGAGSPWIGYENDLLFIESDTTANVGGWDANGVRMTIADGGNVGIGTSAPGTNGTGTIDLDVGSTASTTTETIRLSSGNGAESKGILSFARNASAEMVLAGFYNGATNRLAFAVNPSTYSAANLESASKVVFDSGGNVGIGTTGPSGKLQVVGQMSSKRFASSDVTFDWNDGNTQSATLAVGSNSMTFANPVDGGKYTLLLKQPTGGDGTVSWPTNVRWSGGTAPTLTTTDSRVDAIGFIYQGTVDRYFGVAVVKDFNET